MDHLHLLAVNFFTQDHPFMGLRWSYLTIVGLAGNLVFSSRFFVQWLASEKKGESVIPVSFWYWSIGGSIIMCVYFIFQRDPVGILAYLPNTAIYMRNLHLIKIRRLAATAAAPTQTPKEESGS